MHPIQMQEGSRGIGMGYDTFMQMFEAVCQGHVREKRAKAFAFVFYDMTNGTIRRALAQAEGFHRLHERSGRDITLFYLHDTAVDAHWREFNARFISALGVADQATPPCMVFFRVHDGQVADVSIYNIDEQTQDPVLIVAELEQYVGEALRALDAENNFSALSVLPKVVTFLGAAGKLGDLLLKLKSPA